MKKGKMLAMVLALVMLAGLLASCGGGTSSSAPPAGGSSAPTAGSESTGTPAAEPSGTVRIMMNVTGGKDDDEMKLFAEALGQATGLTIEAEKPASDYSDVLIQKLNAGEEYDLVQVGASQYMNFVEQGILMDITERVKASDILTNNVPEQEWADITIDGKVYAGFNKIELHRVVAINKNMLESVGIDYKTIDPSLDGYYEVMKKLKDEGGFGADFYPFNTILSETWDLQPWFSSAGLKNGVVLGDDGLKYSPYASAEAAPVWEWFKKLYDEGLMDPASFVDKTKDMREKMGAASQRTAITADWCMWVGLHNANAEAGGVAAEDFEIVSLPGIDGPNGYMLGKGAASLFAVPINSPNPDGAFKVLEYFATQEGGDLLSIGIEGHDYNVEGDKVVLTEMGTQHAKDHGAPIPIYKDWVARAGLNRGVEEGLEYLKYATIDLIIPNEGDWKNITGKWAIQMVRGDISIEDGLEGMNNELIAAGVVEK